MSARILQKELLAGLPPEWPMDVLPEIQSAIRSSGRKIVVLDDDPTGTQTVYDVPVLTEWTVDALCAEFADDAALMYILTNSRSLPLAQAQALNAEIGHNLVAAGYKQNRSFFVISRSDSTLRGHYPGEVDALATALGGYDAILLIPAFFPGGRYTIADIHYVGEGEWLVPAAETEFARDSAFGYQASNLREWVQEKSGGRIAANHVVSLSLQTIRQGGPQAVANELSNLTQGSVCVVNASSEGDMAVVALGAIQAETAGKRLLYRTAATFVATYAGLEPRSLLTAEELSPSGLAGGLIVMGSYVPKSSSQLAQLLEQPDLISIEMDVEELIADDERHLRDVARVSRLLNEALPDGDVVLYTSRRLVSGANVEESLAIGRRVSQGVVDIVRNLTTQPRYLLATGGITSSDVATHAMGVKRAVVLGQILPGIPVWHLGPESRCPGLIYIVFPGNVGRPDALDTIREQLKRC